MRYVEKLPTPDFFIEDTKGFTQWEDYNQTEETKNQRRALRQHMLEHEQNCLCIYCESKISIDNSHIEHVKPKAQGRFPELTFVYDNLTVSCNGTSHNQEDDIAKYSCGHKKEDEYDEKRFLDPTKVKDIRDYFVYDCDDFEMLSSGKNDAKSEYTIRILKLDSPTLSVARRKALKTFRKKMGKVKDIKLRKAKIKTLLNSESLAFVSLLKFKYQGML
jgi:uncharacterized protein (TIGR02646 family)